MKLWILLTSTNTWGLVAYHPLHFLVDIFWVTPVCFFSPGVRILGVQLEFLRRSGVLHFCYPVPCDCRYSTAVIVAEVTSQGGLGIVSSCFIPSPVINYPPRDSVLARE